MAIKKSPELKKDGVGAKNVASVKYVALIKNGA
jgi:hypothetical protein